MLLLLQIAALDKAKTVALLQRAHMHSILHYIDRLMKRMRLYTKVKVKVKVKGEFFRCYMHFLEYLSVGIIDFIRLLYKLTRANINGS